MNLKYVFVLFLIASTPVMDAITRLAHNQIELEIKGWCDSYYSNDSGRTGIAGAYLCVNHIKPIELIIRNNGLHPVRISRESLKVSCIGRATLLKNVSPDLGKTVLGTLATLYGAMILMAVELIQTERVRRRAAGGADLNAFQALRNTATWTSIAAGAVVGSWYFDTDRVGVIALDALLLGDEVVINPGDAVRKVAFLDAKAYNGLFTFRVLSDDKKSYAAFFDVELVR